MCLNFKALILRLQSAYNSSLLKYNYNKKGTVQTEWTMLWSNTEQLVRRYFFNHPLSFWRQGLIQPNSDTAKMFWKNAEEKGKWLDLM